MLVLTLCLEIFLDNVKKVLHDLGYAASRAVGKAFLKITKKQMTDAGMSIADANAILAEVEPLQGSLLLLNHRFSSAKWLRHSLVVHLSIRCLVCACMPCIKVYAAGLFLSSA